jgi:dienelactone hydrolase
MACPDCFSGSIWTSSPAGKEEIIHGVRTYVATPPDATTGTPNALSASTILFITDAFGFKLVNSKLLADQYAAHTGLRVLVPDLMPGGGVSTQALDLINLVRVPVTPWWNIWGHLKRIAASVRMIAMFLPFGIRIRGAQPKFLTYACEVKKALPPSAKLGVAGFCVGGMFSAQLAAESASGDGAAGDTPLIDAHFTAHPSGLKLPGDWVALAQKFHVPCSIAIGDCDVFLPRDAVDKIEAGLRVEYGDEAEAKLEVRIYEGCTHGFSVRADRSKKAEDEAAGRAAMQAVEWFKKFLT